MTQLWFSAALLPDGWVHSVRLTIADGLIAAVEVGAEPENEPRYGIALPGLANLHSHTFQRGMAGLAECRSAGDQDNFWSWRDVMYRFMERLDPDDVETIAALAFMEMLETGFTRVGEFHYLHHDRQGRSYADPAELAFRIIAAAQHTGIGLTLLPSFYAHANFAGQPLLPQQRRFGNTIDRFACIVERARQGARQVVGMVVGVAPHSLRSVTPDELSEVISIAGSGPIHIHVAEQMREVEDCLSWSGQRPVEWLLNHHALNSHWCLIHATHTSAEECLAVADTGAIVGLCPITEANLGDGIFAARAFQDAGGKYGIGSDSNILIDASAELRQLEYGQRLSSRSRNVLASGNFRSSGRSSFEMAAAAGRQALGASHGGLAVGEPADIVTLSEKHLGLASRTDDAGLDGWIFGARTTAIEEVWVRGRHLVSNGRHINHDEIERRYRQCLKKILA